MRREKWKVILILICLSLMVFCSGCEQQLKTVVGWFKGENVRAALQQPYTQRIGDTTVTYNPPSPTGGMNFQVVNKSSTPYNPEGNVTLQIAGMPGALGGTPYISVTSRDGVSVGQPLVGVNPYLNYPGVNFETGITLGTTGPGAYVQGGYISKGSKIGIIGKESWGSGKPESSVSLQKQIGNGVASLNYYEGGGLGVGYKMPF
jgi:hypothetical protein